MSYANIIGRNKEINILDRIYKSKKSELVAIYGRRRVGKSYLVSECFGKKILFKAVGTYIKETEGKSSLSMNFHGLQDRNHRK